MRVYVCVCARARWVSRDKTKRKDAMTDVQESCGGEVVPGECMRACGARVCICARTHPLLRSYRYVRPSVRDHVRACVVCNRGVRGAPTVRKISKSRSCLLKRSSKIYSGMAVSPQPSRAAARSVPAANRRPFLSESDAAGSCAPQHSSNNRSV
jgi:hypothetical protein